MRLNMILMHIKKVNPNGHIYRGKYRLVRQVLPENIQKMKNDFAIEEQNMFYLRHSYLTAEQSHGHSKALGLHEKKFQDILKEQRMRFKDHVTLEERLRHLRHDEPWE